ncbi:MAG: T9SS type A sorting domain-containing protein, partial [Bacteroidetes bacterium]|nr:T9SS type A sorting domain-containing protein [Bacteroidota bacterium]
KGYVTNGLGVESRGYDSTYEYDPSTDTWTVKTAAPVSNVALYVAFSIDTLGYYLAANKFWSYSTTTNRWDSLPDFPGSNRDAAAVVSMGHSAYVIMGEYGKILNDIWQYRPDCPANIINEISLSSKSNIFCGSASIDSIKADSIAYASTVYQWLTSSDSNSFTPLTGSDSVRLLKRTFNNTTYLKRVVTLTAGCFDTSAAIGIHVISISKPTIDTLTNTSLCAGDTVVLACMDTLKKSWYLNDTILTDTGKIFKTVKGGLYKVVVTTLHANCKDTSAEMKISYLSRPVPIITQVGSSLTTGAYAYYQWYDTALIPGANGKTYTPSHNGLYRVSVEDSITGCTGSSAFFTYRPTAVSNVPSLGDKIQLFPNPAGGSITLTSLNGNESITIINEFGQLVHSYQAASSEQTFDISGLPSGSYFIRITNITNSVLKHFVKL